MTGTDVAAYVEALCSVAVSVDTGRRIGKRIGSARYLHVSAIPPALLPFVERAADLAAVERDAFDVVRFAENELKLSLLAYPGFMRVGFPVLAASWTVDLAVQTATQRRYEDHANPPVLHRKELMLTADHPRQAEFSGLTAQAERAGLFADVAVIGHRLQWLEELRARNLRVEDHVLVERSLDDDDDPVVHRHRTALSRRALSTPVQALWRHGYFDGERTFFDYGCGRGDDVATLQASDLTAAGWDPYYRPDSPRQTAAVVNLGFVLNVIEDPAERVGALQKAFALTSEVLSVAALIGGRTARERHRLHGDGVLTTRGTFQKYFTHAELGQYIEHAVNREPVSVAPGVYFVFNNDAAEQRFFANRQESTRHLMARRPMPRSERAGSANPKPASPRVRKPKLNRWQRNAGLVERYWNACLRYGRVPSSDEFAFHDELRAQLGLPKTVLRQLLELHGGADFAESQRRRREDVLVYLALGMFERRRSFGLHPERVQRDVKEHWGALKRAEDDARQLLFAMGQPELVVAACDQAGAEGLGAAKGGRLAVASDRVDQLPAVVRALVGTACRLYGDVDACDGVKVDARRRIVTFRVFATRIDGGESELSEWAVVELGRGRVRFYSASTSS